VQTRPEAHWLFNEHPMPGAGLTELPQLASSATEAKVRPTAIDRNEESIRQPSPDEAGPHHNRCQVRRSGSRLTFVAARSSDAAGEQGALAVEQGGHGVHHQAGADGVSVVGRDDQNGGVLPA
jgi:hypothetical protein